MEDKILFDYTRDGHIYGDYDDSDECDEYEENSLKNIRCLLKDVTFDYFVPDSGYTSRLVRKTITNNYPELIYIYDPYWGRETPYIFNNDNITKELVGLKKSICFKCNNLNESIAICEKLMNEDYCGCFYFSNVLRITLHHLSNSENVLIFDFDTESG